MNFIKTLIAVLGAIAATLAVAQPQRPDFPSKTVRFILPFPPGSGPDMVVRQMAEKLQKKWGQPVIVDAKPGANGLIAIDAFKRGANDGHDLLLIDGSNLVLHPHLYKQLPYDANRDFELVAPLFRSPLAVLVSSQSKLRSVGDIIKAAKASPGKLNYGSWGLGSFGHLGGSMLATATGTKMEHVVYKETNQLFIAVTTGEMDFALGSLATVTTFSGRMSAIAAATAVRIPTAPTIPTVGENGGPAGFEVSGWTMFVAPKGLPASQLDMIKRDIDNALHEPDIKSRFQVFGWENMAIPRAQIPVFVAAESTKYGDVIRRTNISLD